MRRNKALKNKVNPHLIDTAPLKLFDGPELETLTLNQHMASQYIPILEKEKEKHEKYFAGKGD